MCDVGWYVYLHISLAFFKMHLANLPNLAKRFNFYIKYLNLSSKCSLFRVKTFQNQIKFKKIYFDIFKGFTILTEFGKLSQADRN